ncbi:MAG: ankyrin repeat domain-containing protein [Archangium sp.]
MYSLTPEKRCEQFGKNPPEEEAMALLEAGVSATWRGPFGDSVVHAVAGHSTGRAVAWLADHGFDLEFKDARGCTPLHEAVVMQNVSTVTELLARKVKVNELSVLKTSHSSHFISGTPLHFALAHGQAPKQIVSLLLEHGADPSLANDQGWRPLHVPPNRYDAVQPLLALLASGVDPNQTDEKGWTCLHHAAKRQAPGCVEALLKAGANPNVTLPKTLKTPLHLAAEVAKKAPALSVIEFLVAGGAKKSAKQKDGQTPLDVAKKKKLALAVSALK